MPLGILKVAACLEQRGIPVELLDLSGVTNYEETLRVYLQSSDAQVFGLTSNDAAISSNLRHCSTHQDDQTRCAVLLGGPHVSMVNAAYRRERQLGASGRATKAFQQLSTSSRCAGRRRW